MTTTIVVAGATGNLGGRIAKALRERGAEVTALVRPGATAEKTDRLTSLGARTVEVDATSLPDLTRACEGASCVVSALAGLRDVIVGAQSVLLDAAVAAGVPRFVPSDYSSDFSNIAPGENRNLELRREFHARLIAAPIRATSILNGAFMELLLGQMPLIDFESRRVNYWENADQLMDFTTIDDTAAFTAAAALDPDAPNVLRIAGDQISARRLAEVAGEAAHSPYELVDMGTLDQLAAYAARDRAADPAGENSLYPRWQGMQYMHGLFSGRGALAPLDNARYPGISTTSVRQLLASR